VQKVAKNYKKGGFLIKKDHFESDKFSEAEKFLRQRERELKKIFKEGDVVKRKHKALRERYRQLMSGPKDSDSVRKIERIGRKAQNFIAECEVTQKEANALVKESARIDQEISQYVRNNCPAVAWAEGV